MNELIIKLTGQITDSNFEQWKGELINQIKSANKELATDGDFVKAEEIVKQFKFAEKSLVEAKQSALEQAADIQKLFSAIDEVSGEARQARLSLEKQIKCRKEEIKAELIDAADNEINEQIKIQGSDFHIVMRGRVDGVFKCDEIYNLTGLKEAIKNKKSLQSMKDSLDLYVSESLDRITEKVIRIGSNRQILSGVNSEYKALFQDESNLLGMEWETLEITIKQRIATHEAEQAKRKAAELEKAEQNRQDAEALAKQSTEPAVEETTPSQPEIAQKQATAEVTPITTTEVKPTQQLEENFEVVVLISGTAEQAKKTADTIDKTVGELNHVVQIKLRRAEKAA